MSRGRNAAAVPLALARGDRRRIGDAIDLLIALLDLAAGDPDMEDDDPDRCLAADDGCGALPGPAQEQRRWYAT